MDRPLAVTVAFDEARRRAAAGREVVLIVDAAESASVARQVAGLGPGRVHLFIGGPADAAVLAAAEEMAGELGARRVE